MKKRNLLSIIMAVFLALPLTGYAQSQIFSRYPTTAPQKQAVSIHSRSSDTGNAESPIKMLFPKAETNADKWCDNSTAQPWVIFEFANYYNVDKFVMTDARIRETGYEQVNEYKIYATTVPYNEVIGGWDDSDWTEIYHGTDGNDVIEKIAELDAPVEARYIKLHILDRGTKPNGSAGSAIRIYGFDIYGEYSRPVDRGNLISVGKTILKAEDQNPSYPHEWAPNMLDGNKTYDRSKWGIPKYGDNDYYHYAVIDLEEKYDITEFKLYDGAYLENNAPVIAGVNIYVSETAPDLSVINMQEDDPNTNWIKLVDSDGEAYGEKEYTYNSSDPLWTAPKTARFVKLEIPAGKSAGSDRNQFTRIFQFEVYGSPTLGDAADATLGVLVVSEGALSPAFSSDVTEYTVLVPKEVESINITPSLSNKKATVTGGGVKELTVGEEHLFPLVVTSEDGTVTKTYNIRVTRAAKSKIATLKSFSSTPGVLFPKFNTDVEDYFLDVPNGTAELTFKAEPTQADAVIDGIGKITLTGGEQLVSVTVTSEDGTVTKTYNITVTPEDEGLFSPSYGNPRGKRIVNVHSYSNKANDNENPYKVLLGERLNTSGNTSDKWCENKTETPWIILSIADIYKLDRIVIRDGELVESSNTNVGNVGGYEIYVSTTGTAEEDFTLIADAAYYAYGDSPSLKDIDLSSLDVEARYVKFVFYRGYKPDGNMAGAIWIYGIDLYGEKSANEIDRNGVVSVGKTIVDHHNNWSDRETPSNAIDGNINYEQEDYNTGEINVIKHEPWAFNASAGDGFLVIDLENEYDIEAFKLYDAADWLLGYSVSVSSTGGDGTWTEVANKTFEPETEDYIDTNTGDMLTRTIGPDPKEITLENAQKGRFVKLSIPRTMMQPAGGFNRIREFEVYGKETQSGLNSTQSDKALLAVYPNPVVKGNTFYVNETGKLSIYSLQGALVSEQTISGATQVTTSDLAKGSYIIRLSNASGVQQAKLIVK